MVKTVAAQELRAMLLDGEELALLDVREEGVFSNSHLLFASSLPLSRLEFGIDALAPRRGARIVLCDDGDGLAERASAKLADLGYTDVAVLDGGTGAWERAGYVLFSGIYVPSKAFGEYVEEICHTPNIAAGELKARLDAGDDLVVLDSRPMDEFRRMNIPTAIDVPGAELAYRVHDIAPSPDTTVVVNCAGRTRSIIGAQSLIKAGIPNPVMALRNGTMGWELAGFTLERGNERPPPAVSAEGLARAQALAAEVAARRSIETIDRGRLAAWRADADRRSLFLLDVRGVDEYEAGHLAGSRPIPGGQLVQSTDAVIGTRNARAVLIDDTGVRAQMTASWLVEMGWPEVRTYRLDPGVDDIETGAWQPAVLGLENAAARSVGVEALAAGLGDGTVAAIDLGGSRAYLAGHIPGAVFALRSRLDPVLDKLAGAETVVFTSTDGRLARLAAAERGDKFAYLAGGTEAWAAAGEPLAEGEESMLDSPDDVWLRPYDRGGDVAQAMNAYLEWELQLVAQTEADGTARFRRFDG